MIHCEIRQVTADIMDEFMAAKPIYLVIPNFNIETSSVEQANDSIAETQHDFIEFGGELVASNSNTHILNFTPSACNFLHS